VDYYLIDEIGTFSNFTKYFLNENFILIPKETKSFNHYYKVGNHENKILDKFGEVNFKCNEFEGDVYEFMQNEFSKTLYFDYSFFIKSVYVELAKNSFVFDFSDLTLQYADLIDNDVIDKEKSKEFFSWIIIHNIKNVIDEFKNKLNYRTLFKYYKRNHLCNIKISKDFFETNDTIYNELYTNTLEMCQSYGYESINIETLSNIRKIWDLKPFQERQQEGYCLELNKVVKMFSDFRRDLTKSFIDERCQ
jgi:hypothetical protein